MGHHKPAGLYRPRGSRTWHIDKTIAGQRLCKSCETSSLEEAIKIYEREVLKFRQSLTGRPVITWQQAAARYITEFEYKKTILDEIRHLEQLDPYIGHLELNQVDDDALQPFIEHRKSQGRKGSTINKALELVRLILNLCARKWKLPSKLYWLESAPMISMVSEADSDKPYPLDWDEQAKLLQLMSDHLAKMSLFDVNTGLRDQEVCAFEWAWEWKTDIKELAGRVWIIPGEFRKAALGEGEDRIVVLNDIAKSVIDGERDKHPRYVFTFDHQGQGNKWGLDRIARMTNTSWQNAWVKAGLPTEGFKKGVHNLRHTFGRRLRAAGVGFETRQALMGHKTGEITTHYSLPEVYELLEAVQRLCKSRKSPELSIIKLRQQA